MSPVGAIFMPFPTKTGTNLLHPLPSPIVELVYGMVQESAPKGRHGMCGMPEGLIRRHDGRPSMERDLTQKPGIAWHSGTC